MNTVQKSWLRKITRSLQEHPIAVFFFLVGGAVGVCRDGLVMEQ